LHICGSFLSVNVSFGSTILSSAGYYDIFFAKLDTAMTIGINKIENSNNNILIFPNPAGNKLEIKNGGIKIELVEIYDVVGERCLVLPLNPLKGTSAPIDVSKLSPGIYFVKLRSEKEERVAKFVKE
jgi:hypothetical protein